MTKDNACLPRQTLKEYLAGWSDAEQSKRIESHLAECNACEDTMVALESNPDTLVEFVRTVGSSSGPALNSNGSLSDNSHGDHANSHHQLAAGTRAADSPSTDSVVTRALEKSRSIIERDSISPSQSTRGWQPPSSEVGPYELLEPLGQGAMGSVFLAKHRRLGKHVAIKLLPTRTLRNEHFAARFQREVRAAGGLDHSAIVTATDAGEFEGMQYLVMEHIDGLDLSRVAKATGPLPIADACELIRQIAMGLSHAHAEGIVHRDIKPSNLMLSKNGAVKILDFGLARLGPWDEASAELTTVGQLMGTLDYMAPEQAERAESVDYRADMYSLGATLFRLLCGRPPLAAAPDLSPLAKLRLLATHEPPALRSLREEVPQRLSDLLSKMLARDPADRPPSATHVAEQLTEFADGSDLEELIVVAKENESLAPSDASHQWTIANAASVPNPPSNSARRKTSSWKWVAACFAIPALILGGVLIALETTKGQLVIRSDSDVSVKLMRDGEFYEELKIVPGVNTTRLYSGKYKIEIDAASDQVSIDGATFRLFAGKTEIATISQNSTIPTQLASPRTLPSSDTELQPGDRLIVRSITNAGVFTPAVVSEDYSVRLAIVGLVNVRGETLGSLKDKLNKEVYPKRIRNPFVEVFRRDLTDPGPFITEEVLSLSSDPAPPSDALVQPGDAFVFNSLTSDELRARVVVFGDNKLHLPLVGFVSTEGCTHRNLAQLLERAYLQTVKSPAIQLFHDPAFAQEFPRSREFSQQQTSRLASDIDRTNGGDGAASIGVQDGEAIEPVYDGKPLSAWLRNFEQERSPKGLGRAIQAIAALLNEENSSQVTATLTRVLPKLDSKTNVIFESSTLSQAGARIESVLSYKIDEQGFLLLAQANPDGRFGSVLRTEFEHADSEWRRRILQQINNVREQDLGAMIDLTKELVGKNSSREEYEELTRFLLQWYVIEELESSLRQRIGDEVLSSERFLPGFWLSQFPTAKSDPRGYQVRLIIPHAFDALQHVPADESLRLQALAILTTAVHLDALTQNQEALLKELAREMLNELRQENITQLTPVSSEFYALAPGYDPSLNGSNRRTSIVSDNRRVSLSIESGAAPRASLANRLLLLASLLDLNTSETCLNILNWTLEDFNMLSKMRANQRITLKWPGFVWSTNWTSSSTADLRSAKPKNWLAYFLYQQAFEMLPEDQRPNIEDDQSSLSNGSRTRSSRTRDTQAYLDAQRRGLQPKNKPEVLYNSRPLSEWLGILPLEKSPEGINEALRALKALASENTNEQIVSALKQTLPQMTEWRPKSRQAGFTVFETIDPEGYYAFLHNELNESDSTSWKTKILESGLFWTSRWELIEPIHKWILKNALTPGSPYLSSALRTYMAAARSETTPAERAINLVTALNDSKVLSEKDWLTSLPRVIAANYQQNLSGIMQFTGPGLNRVWAEEVARHISNALQRKSNSRTEIILAVRCARLMLNQEYKAKFGSLIGTELVDATVAARIQSLVESDELFAKSEEALHKATDRATYFRSRKKPRTYTEHPTEIMALLTWIEDRPGYHQESFRKLAAATHDNFVALMFSLFQDREFWYVESENVPSRRFDDDPYRLGAVFRWKATSSKDQKNASEFDPELVLSFKIFAKCLEQLPWDEVKVIRDQVNTELRKRQNAKDFQKFDADDDDALDTKEFERITKEIRSLLIYSPEFTLADKDSDGAVTEAELLAFRDATLEKEIQSQERRKGTKASPQAYVDWASKNIQKYDRNGDGQLTKPEWEKMIIKPTGADANGDGIITIQEYANWRANIAKR
ncbi:MAG: protein kinase [Pirellulaceae bacterium]